MMLVELHQHDTGSSCAPLKELMRQQRREASGYT
jgi:hypothetical protein